MFSLIVLEDTVRIPPEKFDKALEIVTHEELSGKFEGIVNNELGFVVAVPLFRRASSARLSAYSRMFRGRRVPAGPPSAGRGPFAPVLLARSAAQRSRFFADCS